MPIVIDTMEQKLVTYNLVLDKGKFRKYLVSLTIE